jgi:hypothetical protein
VLRAAAIEAELINLEARFALSRVGGEQPTPTELNLHSRLTNTLRRVCEVLGWQRHAKDITPTLNEYARDHARRRAEDADYEAAT